jgi:predicted dehydrogenase
MALVDHCMTLPPGSDYFSLSVFGSAGAAYADDHHNMHLLYRGGRPTALPAGQGRLHHLAEFQEFVHAIETGRPPAINAAEGHNAAQVVRAAGRSLKSGRAMRLVGSCYEFV